MKTDLIDERNPDDPPKAFFVMRIRAPDLTGKNQCYSDDPRTVHAFMLGRSLSDYCLWINDRIYDWSKDPTAIEEHLKHALEIDNAFYPPEEFPRGHWWE